MQKKFYESNLKVLLSFQSLVFHNMHWRSNVKCPGEECYEISFLREILKVLEREKMSNM